MIIVISAANADVCLSMARIIKSSDFYKNVRLIGLTPDSPWPAREYFDDIITVPLASDPAYGAALADIFAKEKPDIFIPFSEAELSWFVKNPGVAITFPVKIIMNSPDILDIFLDKQKTAVFLKAVGLDVPVTLAPGDVTVGDLPVLIKPRCSAGSKNMAVIRNQAQLDGFRQEHSHDLDKYIAQELIDVSDAEFTCGVWRGGDVLRYCAFRRKLQGGMTGFARVERISAIDLALEKIARAIKGDFFINVQLRLREEIPYIFEINPRFSSTVMMRHKIGFQDLIWTLDRALGRPESPFLQPSEGTEIFRVSEECIVSKHSEAA